MLEAGNRAHRQPVALRGRPVERAPRPGEGLSRLSMSGDAYTISGLPPGRYRVVFGTSLPAYYFTQYYDDKDLQSEAQEVLVGSGQTPGRSTRRNPNPDPWEGAIAGTVTDSSSKATIAGIEVCPSSSARRPRRQLRDHRRARRIPPYWLTSGEYEVEFRSPPRGDLDYVRQRYGPDSAVTVVWGSITPAVSAQLHEGGAISGVAPDAESGQPAAGVSVCAYNSLGESEACATTEASGSYRCPGSPRDATPSASKRRAPPAPTSPSTSTKSPPPPKHATCRSKSDARPPRSTPRCSRTPILETARSRESSPTHQPALARRHRNLRLRNRHERPIRGMHHLHLGRALPAQPGPRGIRTRIQLPAKRQPQLPEPALRRRPARDGRRRQRHQPRATLGSRRGQAHRHGHQRLDRARPCRGMAPARSTKNKKSMQCAPSTGTAAMRSRDCRQAATGSPSTAPESASPTSTTTKPTRSRPPIRSRSPPARLSAVSMRGCSPAVRSAARHQRLSPADRYRTCSSARSTPRSGGRMRRLRS